MPHARSPLPLSLLLSWAVLLATLPVSAKDGASPVISFENVTATALDAQAGSEYRFDAVWTDFNGNGCPDPFIFGHADPATSRLWLNHCDGSGRFTLVDNAQVRHYINPPLLPLGAGWMTLLDINGDGREDFWLRHANMIAARYYNGSEAGSFVPRFERKAEGCDDDCVFADIDGDGRLDIIHPDRRVVDIISGRERYPAVRDRGEAIVFDVDGDGWPDIVQPGGGGYWHNRSGSLVWVDAGLRGDQPALAADLDLDGHLDLMTITSASDNGDGQVHLFRNLGDGRFQEVTASSGLQDLPVTPWWTTYGNRIAADLDNDGLPDLMLTSFERRRPVLLFRNLGGLRFAPIDIDLGPAGQGSEGSVARADLADYDFDGRLDLVKTQAGSNIGLWRNTSAAGRWMQARVRGPGRNSDGVGTALRWRDPASGRLLAHEVVQISHFHPRRVLHAGLGDHARVDLEVRFPHDGPAWRFPGLASDQAVIVFPDGCLIAGWRPGSGWPLTAPDDCRRRGEPLPAGATETERETETETETTASAGAALPSMLAALAMAATDTTPSQRIDLLSNGAQGDEIPVTFGIPLPPGALADAAQLRIVDERGDEVPARVTETLRWHFKDDSIRAVRVQLRTTLPGERRRLRFELGRARNGVEPEPWPYTDGLVDGDEGLRVPGVLALLDPAWLSASLVAGPQVPAGRASRAYDAYFARQFQWAGPLPVDDEIAFLFDRPSTLFKQYVRTGDADHLRAAIASYRLYMSKLVRDAEPTSRRCGGGLAWGRVNPCDVKHVYIEPVLLALALTGDDSMHDDALVGKMARLWEIGGWSGIRGPYTRVDQDFTERQAGLGLLAIVSAYELTGQARYRRSIDQRIGWLYEHQRNNPDGLGDEGCWRHSWQRHEGNSYDPATDIRGCSPWMSENIIDGLWHAWLVTEDERIPTMITGFGQWLEQHGWIGDDAFERAGHSWRDPCSGPDGQIAWYFGSSQVPVERLIEVQDSEGWFSDAHTVQLALPVAAARHFETDPGRRAALEQRLRRIEGSYATACAASAATPRRFNWNHRGSGVVQWFRQNPPLPR